jgi:hypothetical protein
LWFVVEKVLSVLGGELIQKVDTRKHCKRKNNRNKSNECVIQMLRIFSGQPTIRATKKKKSRKQKWFETKKQHMQKPNQKPVGIEKATSQVEWLSVAGQ